jgi:hypothetical protein
MKPIILLAVTALLAAGSASAPAAAQQAGAKPLPAGYKVRADNPAAKLDSLAFETMPPGWHITTGPAVILYDPTRTASGTYRVVSQSFLFPPGQRNEAYGVFIGGRNLDGADQAYTYFVIRRSGEFSVRRRTGNSTSAVVDWTASPAILKYDDRGEGETAKNVLTIEVGQSTVRFIVNDREVANLPRASLDTDGIIGLRVNHSLNLHVSSLNVER